MQISKLTYINNKVTSFPAAIPQLSHGEICRHTCSLPNVEQKAHQEMISQVAAISIMYGFATVGIEQT